MENFEKLGLSKDVTSVLKELRFTEPSEIQEKAIPLVLAGKDIIGGSATGSGKTLAFSASILEKLKPNKTVQSLILTPTRELAEQVATSIKKFGKNKRLSVLPVYGGVGIENQIRDLYKADVVVGTPGRILDHMQRGSLDLRNIKFLVLDEVDRMFDMGFHRDVEKIISQTPKERQTMLFSATISANIDHLAQKYTKNPVEVSVKSYVDHSKLKQIYYDVPNNLKFSLLVHLLKEEDSGLVMVFCSTRTNVDFVVGNLNALGIEAKAIHGGMEQNKRIKVLNDFHGKSVAVLVCTDVAARGLDIKGVSHVYNYDLPKTSDEYIHRVGRTARAGTNGKAINLLSDRDYDNFRSVMRDEVLKANIKEEQVPELKMISIDTSFGRKQHRGPSRGRDPSRGRSFGNRGRSFGNRRQSSRNQSSARRNVRPRTNSKKRY